MNLKDKVAIVTGSGRGLGRAYAERFAREGAKVAVCDIIDCSETVKAIEAMGGEVLSLKTDVTKEKDTVELAKKTVERFGRIDILVNNAALYGGMVQKPFWEFSVDEWDNMMAINLKGTFLPCKAVFPYMKEQKKGKIINITSTAVFLGIPFITPYTTTKGGIIAFTRELARELGDFNINVNCLSPGLTWTKASQDLIPAEEVTRNTGAMCFKRIEQPDDLPGAVMFLASEDSDFITGQTLVVDGGTFLH